MKLRVKLKSWMLKGMKYGKWIGIVWIVGFIVLAPVLFLIGGWPLLLAYIACKLSGVCPL